MTHLKKKRPANQSVACASTPLLGVYHSSRLHVLKTCQCLAGTVIVVRQVDGDTHFNGKPDRGYAGFLDQDNYGYEDGGLAQGAAGTNIRAGGIVNVVSATDGIS